MRKKMLVYLRNIIKYLFISLKRITKLFIEFFNIVSHNQMRFFF